MPEEDISELMNLEVNYPELRQPRPIRIEEPETYVYDDFYNTPFNLKDGETEMMPQKIQLQNLPTYALWDIFRRYPDYTKDCEDWKYDIASALAEFGNSKCTVGQTFEAWLTTQKKYSLLSVLDKYAEHCNTTLQEMRRIRGKTAC